MNSDFDDDWWEDDELGQALEAERGAPGADSGRKARVLAGVLHAAGVGVAAGTAATAGSAGAVTAGAGSGGASGAAVGGAGGAGAASGAEALELLHRQEVVGEHL